MYTVQQFAGQQMQTPAIPVRHGRGLLSPADNRTDCPSMFSSMMPMIMMIMMMAIMMPMMKGMTGSSKS